MKVLIYLFVFLFLVSCNLSKADQKTDFSCVDLSKSIVLENKEGIIDFYDKYPVSITVRDSLMYIMQIRAENCIMVLNLNTKQVIDSLGHTGHGPDDLISPSFILSEDNSETLVEDANLKKIMKIESNPDGSKLVKYGEYPDSIYPGSEINVSKQYITGRKVNMLGTKMFFIYNKEMDTIFEADCFPKLEEEVADINMTYAPAIAFNENKNRIIVGMYFFDMFHIYDLTGKRLKTYCFSDHPIPSVNKEMKGLDLSNGYSGIIRTFSTDDYCYLLRMTHKGENDPSKYMIIQLNWDGELINSYLFNDDVSGQFYVDEKMKKLYAICRSIDSKGEEVFGIVSYGI